MPEYANIFIDGDILKIAKVKFFRRYLDDIYMLFNGTRRNLHEFLQMINQIKQIYNDVLYRQLIGTAMDMKPANIHHLYASY